MSDPAMEQTEPVVGPQSNASPFDFGRIVDLQSRARDAGLIDKDTSLPDFARQMNDLSGGTGMFDAGLKDSKIKRVSLAIDKGLAATKIPDISADLFGGIGKMISPELEESGRRIGRDFPRSATDTAMVLGGMGLAGTGFGATIGIPLIGVGSADTFAKTYTDTGSPVAGLISTGAQLALPSFSKYGAEFLSPLARSLTETMEPTIVNGVKTLIPVSKAGVAPAMTERLIDFLGMNLGAAANQELSQQATSLAVNHDLINPFTKEHAFELGVGLLPMLPFEARNVIKGPGVGEVRSFTELARLKDAEAILSKASRENSERAYLYTAEKSKSDVQNDYVGGTMPSYTTLGEHTISAQDVLAATKEVKTDRSQTLMGKPLDVPAPVEPISDIPMLTPHESIDEISNMASDDFMKFRQRLGVQTPDYQRWLGEEVGPEKLDAAIKDIDAKLGGAAPTDEKGLNENASLATKRQFLNEALNFEKSRVGEDATEIVKAAELATSTHIETPQDLESAAKLTNEAAKLNGDPGPVVTDKTIGDKVNENLKDGVSMDEAVDRAGKAVQNRLNRTAGEVQERMTKAEQTSQTANEDLGKLSPVAQDVVGQAITKMSKEHAGEMDTDLSDAWTRAAVKWAKDQKNAAMLGMDLDENQKTEAVGQLTKILGGVAKNKTLERTRSGTQLTGGAKSIYSDEVPGSLIPEVSKMSPSGQEAMGDVVKAENKIISDKKDQLTGDVTLEEVKPFKPKADQKYVDRLSAIVSHFAQGNIERAYDKGKWKFTYHDIEALRQAFGGKVTNKTIMDFVKDNYEVLGQVLQKRLGTDFMTFGRIGGKIVGVPTAAIKQMGEIGTFPATTRAFFTHYFLNRGLTTSESMRLGEIATKIAAAYKEINPTRIASLVGEGAHGVSLNVRPDSELAPRFGVIGIRELNSFAKGTNGALETFLKLHTLAHEVFHSMVNAWQAGQVPDEKAKAVANAFQTAADMEQIDKYHFVKDLVDMVIPRQLKGQLETKQLIDNIAKNAAESDSEFLATYSGLATLALASPSGFKGNHLDLIQHLNFGDKHLTDFVHSQYLDLLDLTGAVKDLFTARGEVAPARWIGQLNDAYKTMYSSRQEIEDAVSKLRYMDNMNAGGLRDILTRNNLEPIRVLPIPSEFGSAVTDFMKLTRGEPVEEGVTSKDLLGQKLNFYEKNLVPAAQIAEMYPITRPVINLGFTFNSVKNKFVTLALTPFMVPDKFGKLVFDEQHGGISKVLGSEKLNDAFSQVALHQNENQRMAEDGEIDTIAKNVGLSPDETSILHQTVKNTSLAMESMAGAMVRSRKDIISIMASRILLDHLSGKVNAQQAYVTGQKFTDALIAAAGQDPKAAAEGAAALAQVQAEIGNPEAFDATAKAVNGILPKYVEFTQSITGKPWYTPEVRLGNYGLRWVEGGEPHFIKVKTKADFEARLAELNKNPNVDSESIKGTEKFDSNNDNYLLSSDMVQKFAAIEHAAFEVQKAMFPGDANTLDKLGYVPGEAAFKEVTAQGIGKYTLKRNLVAGREEINMMEGVLDYVTGVSGGLAKGYTRNLAALYLADPTMKANPQIAAFLRDHIQSVTSSPKEWQTIKNMVFHFTLGGNISSMIVERLQPLFTLVPHLVQNGSSIAGSYGYMGKAMKTLWQIAAKDTSSFDPRLQIPEMLKRASQDKVIDFGIYEELASQEDVGTLNLRNLATQNAGVNSATSLLSKPLFWYTRFARGLYTKASTQNNRVAFLSSYLMAMEKGVKGVKMTPEQAYQFATDSVHSTMFGGGRAGRPVGMFSNLGKTYGAVSAWYMLQHYTTSSIAMMYRLMMDGLGKTGLESAQVSQSRKALSQMVLTQTLMSGTLGLPLVGGTMAILEQIFPNLEAKKKVRETLAGLAGDDHEMGELIADSFLHGGLPRALGLGMVDLSGRFGLGNVLGVDPEYGFQPEAVFGAPGSVFGNILRGVGSASTGSVGQGIQQAAPLGWRNMIRMYNDDWNVRDSSGRQIFEPTTTESILGSIGFRPKRLSEFQEQQRLLQRSNDVASRELKSFHNDLADLMLSGQADQVRALLLQRHQEDPLYDPRAGLHAVVQTAQDKSVPLDPNQGSRASLDEREKISQTFQKTASRPSEVSLLMAGKQMERSVGIAGAGTLSRHELTIAQMVDQMLQLNPALGRQMARAMVEKQLAHRPQPY